MLQKREVAAEPVTRLTPHFDDITIEDLAAAGAGDVGVIAGLSESRIQNLTLRDARVAAETGLTVGFAQVPLERVWLKVHEGPPIRRMAGAEISTR